MSDDSSNPSDPRIETGSQARQLPQEAHLRKRFGKFQDFIDQYSSRISLGGIFVDADILQPVGGEVYLDFRLEDGYRLLHGLGEVVWVRLKTMSDERPKGMGVRFLSLDEGGRELVLKLLEEQVKSGGAPFEVDRVPDDGSIDPTVVQALAGPSDEENQAAHKAKTGAHAVSRPDDDDDEEDLPELPPGVLPPPDDEPDFSAPWGERLPEIPDDLLDEPSSAARDAAPTPSIPAVEAPESPYAPGSDDHPDSVETPSVAASADRSAAIPEATKPTEAEQAGFEFETPAHGEDPQLDESDFGVPEAKTPPVQAVGGTTDIQQAQPFGDFEGDSLPDVDGTLFQMPSGGPPASPQAATDADAAPSFGGADTPGFEAGFDNVGFDAGTPQDDGFDAEFGGGDLAGADFGDDSSSQVAPPADIGDDAGAAWSAEYDPEAVPSAAPGSASPVRPSAPAADDGPPPPSPQESAAMDAAMDIESEGLESEFDNDGFAFEPPEEDLLDDPVGSGLEDSSWSTGDGTAGGVADDGIDATHAAVSSFDDDDGFGTTRPVPDPAAVSPAAQATEPSSSSLMGQAATGSSPGNSTPSSTEKTADDLFAFRGPADAQPAVDLEETASIRGSALPDLSDTMMGTKEPAHHDGGDLTGSYDDWEEWAPHPASSGGKTKVILGVVLLLALAAGAGYYFRDTLMQLAGLDGGGESASAGLEPPADDPAAADSAAAESDAGDTESLEEPVEGIDLDEFLDEGEAAAADSAAAEVGDEEPPPITQADAASLRPPPTRRDAPPPSSSPAPATTRPPPADSPPASAASTGRPARQVQSIQVRSRGPGTEVVVRFDGDLASSRYSHDVLSWAADREMVTLRGIGNFEQTEIRGNTSELLRVRVGHHPGDELRLVFDKTSGEVAIRGIEARGNQLIIRLSA